MKLVLAAPASGLPSLPIAFDSHASRVHFVMKLFSAAPASALPSLPIALLRQALSATATELSANVISRAARQFVSYRASIHRQRADSGARSSPTSPPHWGHGKG